MAGSMGLENILKSVILMICWKGQNRIYQLTKMSLSLTITAIDLSLVEVDIEKIRLGDNLKCVSKEHKIDDYFLCVVLEKIILIL